MSSTPRLSAAACRFFSCDSEVGLVGLTATANGLRAGRTSRMNSSRLRETSTLRLDTPVRLPPGRDRLLHHAERDGIAAHLEDDRDRRRRRFRRQRDLGAARRHDHGQRAVGQLLRQRRQPAVLAVGPPVLDRDVAPFGVAGVGQAFAEGSEAAGVAFRRFRAEIADDRQGLRACRRPAQRRRGHGTAGQRHEAAPSQAIDRFGKRVAREPHDRLSPPPVSLGTRAGRGGHGWQISSCSPACPDRVPGQELLTSIVHARVVGWSPSDLQQPGLDAASALDFDLATRLEGEAVLELVIHRPRHLDRARHPT